jgi:hypothetical protein
MRFPIDAKLFALVDRIENAVFPSRRTQLDLVDKALG